jgi:anthranilate/para-aminobenzoate synthase component II
MSDNLTEIKGPNGIVTIGMDALVDNQWGKVEKISSAWHGTIFIRFHHDTPLRKFNAFNGIERTNDQYHFHYASFHTPEQKCAIIVNRNIEQQKRTRAYRLQAIKWEYAPESFITSVYNLALENKLIDAPQVPH